MNAENLMDDRVKIGKTVRELIVCRVSIEFKKLVSQLCLHVLIA